MKKTMSKFFPPFDKEYLQKPIANIKLNVEKLEAFPLKSGTKQECLLLPLFFNLILWVTANVVIKRKEDLRRKKYNSICSQIPWYYFMWKIKKNIKRKNLLELIDYNKVARYKINIKKSIAFLYTNSKLVDFEVKNAVSFTLASPK